MRNLVWKTLALFFFMAALKIHATPMEETVMRHACGIIFQRQGRIDVIKSKWLHHFDLELMMTAARPTKIPIQTTPCQNDACVIKKGLVEVATTITDQAHQRVNKQIEKIHELLRAGVPTETK